MITRADAPMWVKRRGRQVSRTFGRYTAGLRMIPDFLMCGGNRCGTTALHRALIEHPLVAPPVLHKSVNYFDVHYPQGPRWYRGHFPVRAVAQWRSGQSERPPLAMEASGYYLDHPEAVHRIARDLPGVKAIVMLRDPVERAHSAHRHNVARGFDSVSFDEAIELEPLRNVGERERMAADPSYLSWADRHSSFVRRGQYVDRLELFFAELGRENVHVLFSERFSETPEPEYARVLEFLGLPPHVPAAGFGRWNPSPPAEMTPRARARLEEHYAPYDDRLEVLLGEPLPWRQPARLLS
ncbi:sulfotransferase domain-containing protein [Marmoricola sp. URHB0036]|uniref:sulfotransferase domain-containing protein n=1 Tax=Marmoricola sp. URHB0036 TaxID=1298863 RepID=UPI0003FC72A1|nr:sulfotransferase domain-containing protein [Marmoricola sp. URHB0036]